MKIKIYSTIFIICLANISFSQSSFQRLIGGNQHERAQTVLSSFDNAYMVNAATGSYGAGGIDAMLIKLDATGQILWSETYGTAGYDNSEFAIETSGHQYICAGRTEVVSGSPTSAMIFKTDSAGNPLWSKTYGGTSNDGFIHITETTDHGFAAVGNSTTLSSGLNDILFVRTDANGDTIFTRSFGTPAEEVGVCVIQLPDNGFMIAGRQSTNSGTKADGILLRTDSLGNQLWSKMYGDTMFEELTAVRQTADGGYIVSGSTTGYGSGGFDILLMKTDSTGTPQWCRVFGGPASDAGYDIHITSDSGYGISGFTESLGYGHRSSGANEANIYLLKTDQAGAFQWMQVYGDGLQDEAYHSNIANDGGFLIGGFTSNYLLTDSSQMIVIKTDSMGVSGCHEESVIPADSVITILYHDSLFTQLSGLPTGNFTLITGSVSTNNDDACLFSGNLSVKSYSSVIAYPNPFSDAITISGAENSEIYIYSVLGETVFMQKNVQAKITVNTSEFQSGVYLISVINDSSRKIIPVILSR